VVVLSWYLLFTASCRSQAENTLITGVQISRARSELIGNGLAKAFHGGAGDDVTLGGIVTVADIYALFAT
jgi:hypothetical protein